MNGTQDFIGNPWSSYEEYTSIYTTNHGIVYTRTWDTNHNLL